MAVFALIDAQLPNSTRHERKNGELVTTPRFSFLQLFSDDYFFSRQMMICRADERPRGHMIGHKNLCLTAYNSWVIVQMKKEGEDDRAE